MGRHRQLLRHLATVDHVHHRLLLLRRHRHWLRLNRRALNDDLLARSRHRRRRRRLALLQHGGRRRTGHWAHGLGPSSRPASGSAVAGHPLANAACDDSAGRLLLLLVERAHFGICAGAEEHEVLGLKDLLGIVVAAAIAFPYGAHGPRRGGHARLGVAIARAVRARWRELLGGGAGGAGGGLPAELLLRLETLLGGEVWRRGGGIEVVWELVALGGEVVLDVAAGLVRVEPALAVVVGLPPGGQPDHGRPPARRAGRASSRGRERRGEATSRSAQGGTEVGVG